jgi:hypothetical protein
MLECESDTPCFLRSSVAIVVVHPTQDACRNDRTDLPIVPRVPHVAAKPLTDQSALTVSSLDVRRSIKIGISRTIVTVCKTVKVGEERNS